MAILFQCPCGRSMVAESDKAGSVVRCPNCSRSLKVPTGKGRGKEIVSAPTAPTTRLCKRCNRTVPIDAQQCPHCKTILVDGAAAPAPAAPASPATVMATVVSGAPARRRAPLTAGAAIRYGGARGGWFSRLSSGGKAGVILGIVGVLAFSGVGAGLLYSSWRRDQLNVGRIAVENAIKNGKTFELQARFQEAYDGYLAALDYAKFLRETGLDNDRDPVDWLENRRENLKYIVSEPKLPTGAEPVRWRAANQQELDAALTHIRAQYNTYRQWFLGVAQAGTSAIETARTTKDRKAYEAKLGQAIDAFLQFTGKASPQQRATFSFGVLTQAIRELGEADRNWDKDRDNYLNSAEQRLIAARERVDTPGQDTLQSSS